MNTDYTPKPGSLAEQVISYFRLHPNDTMTIDDLVETFRPTGTKGNIKLALEKAVDAGLLIWRGGLLMAGAETMPDTQPTAQAKALASPFGGAGGKASSRKEGGRGHRLPPLDIDAVKVDYDAPLPVCSTRENYSRWTALLDKLDKLGASISIPREYNGSLGSWIRKVKKSQPQDKRVFRVGLDAKGVNRVWRTA